MFGQKPKFCVKNRNFEPKILNLGQKSKFWPKNQNFGPKSKINISVKK